MFTVELPDDAERVPRWLWRMLGLTLVAVIVGSGVMFAVLALGAADLPLAGPLVWEQVAPPDGCLAVDTLALPALNLPVTVEAHAEVETLPAALATWGVWIDRLDSTHRWEVLPPGYYRYADETFSFFHVQAGLNELRLDVELDGVRLWLNRELVLNTSLALSPVIDWGVLGDARVCWQRLAVYAGD